ncbi:MAG: TraB/GumN family protein [Candidatus Neomarinimicrobiota bacterium]|jgi:pheromone shutdown-related protein TraB|nr:TraB/GumN family protein [Candidatus Neomarinimicrobiota bacterium]
MKTYSDDVKVLKIDNRVFYLIGTAHISKISANLVDEVIKDEKPDCVCLELDKKRYESLKNKKKWENLNLKEVIRKKQLSTLLINVALASYQKKLAKKLDIEPGNEFMSAILAADKLNIPIELCDRDIRITLRRTWKSLSIIEKIKFLFLSDDNKNFEKEVDEKLLAELRKTDVISKMISDLGKKLPSLKRVLIDERDHYLAEKIKNSSGNKIVAVVGAGHMSGIIDYLEHDKKTDLKEIEKIPPISIGWKLVGWVIPFLIVGSILYIGINQGLVEAGENILVWVLANGVPSMIGAIIALSHPYTILSAFFSAPFTSLTPIIGAGYVSALVQINYAPPLVKNFNTVTDDFTNIKKWWTNKLLKVFLIFILTGFGSAVGTYFGAFKIFSNLYKDIG